MEKFYFTRGPDDCPVRGGWVEIIAPNKETAAFLFRQLYPSGYFPGASRSASLSIFTQEELWAHMPVYTQNEHACLRGRITVTHDTEQDIIRENRRLTEENTNH